jgi:hypothetical protein
MKEYFEYLNELRNSGTTNMFGAGPYLQDEFQLNREEARMIIVEWMNNPWKYETKVD